MARGSRYISPSEKDFFSSVSSVVFNAREEKFLTRHKVADLLGVPHSTYWQWEFSGDFPLYQLARVMVLLDIRMIAVAGRLGVALVHECSRTIPLKERAKLIEERKEILSEC